ncbi:DnaJ domain-containing protein [Bisporella sp. PMI_857]|nr:DnaJ domain-containing protein [Bisporella sp. PMI_857]
MPPPNYYTYLGTPTNATEEELKKAYRRRSMELHPDKNPGKPNATADFQALQKAWDVLKDPYRKAHYGMFSPFIRTSIYASMKSNIPQARHGMQGKWEHGNKCTY